MIPRACDDDRCDYGPGGWQHHHNCPTQAPGWADDIADQTALEDGVWRRRRAAVAGLRRAA